jgi:hypothetical protein
MFKPLAVEEDGVQHDRPLGGEVCKKLEDIERPLQRESGDHIDHPPAEPLLLHQGKGFHEPLVVGGGVPFGAESADVADRIVACADAQIPGKTG